MKSLLGALRSKEALVELATYQPLVVSSGAPEPDPTSGPRYTAFVLRAGSAVPVRVELGTVADVDRAVEAARAQLSNRGAPLADVVAATARAYDLIWRPLAPALGDTAHALVVTDGNVTLMPLEALHDGASWLIDRELSISYLNSTRELIDVRSARAAAVESLSGPMVYANPAPPEDKYSDPALAAAAFRPLPYALAEAAAIKRALPDATVMKGTAAGELSLLNVYRPYLLHVATHGTLLAPTLRAGASSAGRDSTPVTAPASRPTSQSSEDDWMRALLIMSEPDMNDSDHSYDSYTTAFEIARMNLVGTQLVMLTGCNTGTGAVSAQHGVRSLRRAFMIAGAQSVIASLWVIPDQQSTADLVRDFYDALVQGTDRADALREAKRAAKKRNEHPYYWASLTLTGDTSPLRKPQPKTAAAR